MDINSGSPPGSTGLPSVTFLSILITPFNLTTCPKIQPFTVTTTMSATATITATETLLAQARRAPNPEECMKLYEQWAATYNNDVTGAENYIAPVILAQTALKAGPQFKGTVLDAGCGTGLVAIALKQGGAATIDGLDLSPPMLKLAEKTGVYRNLVIGDLNQKIAKADDSYDLVTCAGTFTQGHVGPSPALREFVRIVKTGGLIVATVLHEIWLSGGFKAEVEKLEAEGLIELVSSELEDYRKGRDKADVVVLRKRAAA